MPTLGARIKPDPALKDSGTHHDDDRPTGHPSLLRRRAQRLHNGPFRIGQVTTRHNTSRSHPSINLPADTPWHNRGRRLAATQKLMFP